jgi:hypothetical protein
MTGRKETKMKMVKVTDTEKIQTMLDEVQKRSKVRTITAADVTEAVERVERQMLHIAKKNMDGVEFTADMNAQSFPGAYKGRPESTLIHVVNKRGVWYLSSAYRDDTKGPTVAYEVKLTDTAKAAILAKVECFGRWN